MSNSITDGHFTSEAEAFAEIENMGWHALARDVVIAEDAIACPPNEPIAIGRAAAKKVWVAYFADKTFTISWKTVHAEVAKRRDLGYTTGTYETSFKGPDGKQVSEKGSMCAPGGSRRARPGRPSTTFGMPMPSRSVTIARGA